MEFPNNGGEEDLVVEEFLPDWVHEKVDVLGGELTQLYADWKMFQQCFCFSHERSSLLFDSAGGFFSCVHLMMLGSLSTSICRLLDPPGRGARKNLVLESLSIDAEKSGFKELGAQLKELLDEIRVTAKNIQQFRNKRISHLDEAVLLGKKKLNGFSIDHIEEALSKMCDFLNKVSLKFPDKVFHAYDTVHVHDGGDMLARKFSQARALKRLIADGKISHQDAKSVGSNEDG